MLAEQSAGAVAPPPSRRRANTRLRIVKAAADVFAASGTEAATVEAILQAAGVSRRTFYQFFRDKQDALAAVYERSTEHLLRLQAPAVARGDSGLACILNGQDTYMHFVAAAGPIVRVLATESLRPDSPLAPRRSALHQRIASLYGNAYERIEGRRLDPLVLMSVILLVESVSIHVMSQRDTAPDSVERAISVLRELVTRMLTPPPTIP